MQLQNKSCRFNKLVWQRISICLFISLMSAGFALGQSTDLYIQSGGSSLVEKIEFSPDGNFFMSISGGTLKLFRTTDHFELKTESCSSASFSEDGKFISCEKSAKNDNTNDYFITEVIDIVSWKSIFSYKSEKSDFTSYFSYFDAGDWVVIRIKETDLILERWDFRKNTLINSQKKNISSNKGEEIKAISSDKKFVVLQSSQSRQKARIINLISNEELVLTNVPYLTSSNTNFSPDNQILATPYNLNSNDLNSNNEGYVAFWNLSGGNLPKIYKAHHSEVRSLVFSPDSKLLATSDSNASNRVFFDERVAKSSEVKIWNVREQEEVKSFDGLEKGTITLAFHPNGHLLAIGGGDESVDIGEELIKFWEINQSKIVSSIYSTRTGITKACLSPNKNFLAIGGFGSTFLLKPGGEATVLINHHYYVFALAFSQDSRILASGSRHDYIQLFDMEKKEYLKPLENEASYVQALSFSSDGKVLASATLEGVDLWNIKTRRKISLSKEANNYDVVFNPNGKLLAVLNNSNSKYEIQIWNLLSKKKVITYPKSQFGRLPKWVKIDKSLANDVPSEIKRNLTNELQYIVSENAIKITDKKSDKELISISPFYIKDDEGISQDWLATTPEGLFDGSPNAWKKLIWRFDNNTFNYAPVEAFFKEFYRPGLLQDIFVGNEIEPPTQDLSKIDIRQPLVKISAIDEKAVNSTAFAPEAISADKKSVRVKVEITDNTSAPRLGISKDSSSDAQDVRLFRNGSLVKFWNGNAFKLAEKDGCKQIAKTKDSPRKAVCEAEIQISAGKNDFTVYGFNRENVKSSDDTAIVTGSESLKRDGTLYVLAVGVNKYANADYNLNYAVKDVADIGKTLQDNQAKLGNLKQYAKTEIITLTDESATKENILKAFARFANGEQTALPENASDKLKAEFAKIKQTQPEDAFIIYFAGHGVSKGQRFYLLPHNFTGDAAKLEEQSVSDLELNDYLEKVDAGKILMVIDACQSGAALGGKNDGKAPMNSKGFAQLAYDKGMLILTAAQSQQAALEAVKIGDKTIENGLLTYALLQAFSNKQSDKDGNSQLWEREWFDFAVNEVPLFQKEAMRRREVDLKNNPQTKDRSGIYYVNGDKKTNAEDRSVQTPRVFYRREMEIKPFILANP